jgi:hypothetical protein
MQHRVRDELRDDDLGGASEVGGVQVGERGSDEPTGDAG